MKTVYKQIIPITEQTLTIYSSHENVLHLHTSFLVRLLDSVRSKQALLHSCENEAPNLSCNNIIITKLLEDIHPHPPCFGTLILITKLLEDLHPHLPCPAILSSSPNYWRIYTPIPPVSAP